MDVLDFRPRVKEAEPPIPEPLPHIKLEGIECQRLGKEGWSRLRYKEVEKKLHAAPVFSTLKINTELGGILNYPSTLAAKQDGILGTIVHGLLLQRRTLSEELKTLAKKHPNAAGDLPTTDQFSSSEQFDEKPFASFVRDNGGAKQVFLLPLQFKKPFRKSAAPAAQALSNKYLPATWRARPAPKLRQSGAQRNGPLLTSIATTKEDPTNDVRKEKDIDGFRGGQLSRYLTEWQRLEAPNSILKIISGYTIPFVTKPPSVALHEWLLQRFATEATSTMTKELEALERLGIVERPNIPEFLQEGDYMGKLDLSLAYFHIPVKESHRSRGAKIKKYPGDNIPRRFSIHQSGSLGFSETDGRISRIAPDAGLVSELGEVSCQGIKANRVLRHSVGHSIESKATTKRKNPLPFDRVKEPGKGGSVELGVRNVTIRQAEFYVPRNTTRPLTHEASSKSKPESSGKISRKKDHSTSPGNNRLLLVDSESEKPRQDIYPRANSFYYDRRLRYRLGCIVERSHPVGELGWGTSRLAHKQERTLCGTNSPKRIPRTFSTEISHDPVG
ncbi:hypothetical protein ACJJTC_008186 [Scirpophaga incertulas]